MIAGIHVNNMVTYPSTFEGFGNAFMEAVYFHKPIVVNRYSIYTKDIKPRGFRAVELDGYVTAAAVKETKESESPSEELIARVQDQFRRRNLTAY